jgi:hypothetical protein
MTVSSISKINNAGSIYGDEKKPGQPAKTEAKQTEPKETYKKDSVKINSKKPVDHQLNTFQQGADYGSLSLRFYGDNQYSNDLEFGRTFSVIAPKTNNDIVPFLAQSGQVGFGLSQAGVGYKVNAGVEVNNVSISLSGQASAGVLPWGPAPYVDARGGVEFRVNIGHAGGALIINPNYGATLTSEETYKSFGVTIGYSIKQF